jgi:hypothetical protein
MTGTVLHDSKRSTAVTTASMAAHPAHALPVEALHLTHGLVAIANGPDYCLCGHTWPCERRTD